MSLENRGGESYKSSREEVNREARPDYDKNNTEERARKKSKILCKYFLTGCRNGQSCRFFHEKNEIQNEKRVDNEDRNGSEVSGNEVNESKLNDVALEVNVQNVDSLERSSDIKIDTIEESNDSVKDVVINKPCISFHLGTCKFGSKCNKDHGDPSKYDIFNTVVPDIASLPNDVTISCEIVGTFGWKDDDSKFIDPPENAPAEELTNYFANRITFPGEFRELLSPLPTVVIKEYEDVKPITKYGRPPTDALLMAAHHYSLDIASFNFITPRRNLLAFLRGENHDVIVHRVCDGGPILMDRVLSYFSINNGSCGAQLESLWTAPVESTKEQFRALIRVKIKDKYVLMSGEVDAVCSGYSSNNELKYSCDSFKEIKSMWAGNDKLKKMRGPKQFIQAVITGIRSLTFGWKSHSEDKQSIIVTPDEIPVESLLDSSISKESLYTSLYAYLEWININTPIQAGKKYRLNYSSKSIKEEI